MSAQTFSNVVAGTTTFQSFRENYNNVASEMNTGVLRLNGPAVVGNVTLNGSATFSQPVELVSMFVVNNATFQQNTTNRLENRDGILFFNGQRTNMLVPYNPVYGYYLGSGNTSTARTVASYRITLSAGTTAAHTPANLSTGREGQTGVSDARTYGYAMGGYTSASVTVVTTDRVTYSTSVTAAYTPGNLSAAAAYGSGLSDGITYGYHLISSTGNRIGFASGVNAAYTPANPTTSRDFTAAVSDAIAYGYYTGGNLVANSERLTYSTGTIAAYTQANISQARYALGQVSDNKTYGYILGGVTGAGARVDTADRITYSTGTGAAYTDAKLSSGRSGQEGINDTGNGFGYIAGGYQDSPTFNYVVTTDRITFSTGVRSTSTTHDLPVGLSEWAGVTDHAV